MYPCDLKPQFMGSDNSELAYFTEADSEWKWKKKVEKYWQIPMLNVDNQSNTIQKKKTFFQYSICFHMFNVYLLKV